jgi:hypothetical protein
MLEGEEERVQAGEIGRLVLDKAWKVHALCDVLEFLLVLGLVPLGLGE